jgi:predicted patatin/cPLA2 family phospholipase
LLQGGGALGAYQAGVYEALAEAHLHPDWIAGISKNRKNESDMDQTMKSVAPPQWMLDLFEASPPRPDSPFSQTTLKWCSAIRL